MRAVLLITTLVCCAALVSSKASHPSIHGVGGDSQHMDGAAGHPNAAHPLGGGLPDHETDTSRKALPSWESMEGSQGDGFQPALTASFFMILVCEVGDKTFFIAMIMSMRYSKVVVFCGALSALAVMTVLSVIGGHILPSLIPIVWTHYLSVVLFLYFGCALLKDAYLDDGESELAEVEEELGIKAKEEDSPLPGGGRASKSCVRDLFSPIVIKAFTMTFLAEWGDRSQIATIALAARKEPFGVTIGGIMGHSICTGLACSCGHMIAEHVSERAVALVGGLLFLVFGIVGAYEGPDAPGGI